MIIIIAEFMSYYNMEFMSYYSMEFMSYSMSKKKVIITLNSQLSTLNFQLSTFNSNQLLCLHLILLNP